MQNNELKLRKYNNVIPKVIAIGSSTGGPKALITIIKDLVEVNKLLPILVTQHIKNGFAQMFAGQISRNCKIECIIAKPNMPLEAGKIYLAPEDKHMTIQKEDIGILIKIKRGRKVNYHRPSVDVLFESVANVFGIYALVVVLTGIGLDGLDGAKLIAKSNGTIIVQNKETSIVWGMPGSVAKAGIANEILPVEQIANKIKNILQG